MNQLSYVLNLFKFQNNIMSQNEEGTDPHFPQNQTASQNAKSRSSQNAASRYADTDECKDSTHSYTFEEADDSDYERVELISERKDLENDSVSQKLASNTQQQEEDCKLKNTNINEVLRAKNPQNTQLTNRKDSLGNSIVSDNSVENEEVIARNDQSEPMSVESSEMHPQEFMNFDIDQVSDMDQFKGTKMSLDLVDQKRMMMASMPHPFRSNDLNPKKQASGFKFVEKALPLVTFNQTQQQFNVNPEVVQMMEQVKGPLGVISVAGMYRTGKSYLINRVLLNRQRGFSVGPTINPCTKGIWIWGTPLSGFNPKGEPINIIVVDSEGLGGIDEDNNHDMRIFSLALLISSYFVYNSMGQIDENAISSLSLVVNLTKHIQLGLKKEKEASLEKVLPSFMWVVRDFALQLEDERGEEISQTEYLEKALQQQSSDPNDQKTIIRKCLKKFFPNRECCTLVRPLLEEEKLQKLEELEIDQLRVEFIEQVMNLRRKILNSCPVKQVHGHAMDGETWISLLSLYIDAINNGNVPNIESAWMQICRNKAQTTFSQVNEQFEREISEIGFPASQPEFQKSIQEAERIAIMDLQKELASDPSIFKEFMSKLKKNLTKRMEELSQLNQAACQEYSQQMLQQLFAELDQIKQQCQEDPQSNSFQQVEYALRELSNYYDANCVDFSEKQLYLSEAKLQFMLELIQIQSHHAINQSRLQSETETQIKEHQSKLLREQKEEFRAELLRLEGQWKQALQLKSELEASGQIFQEQLTTLKEVKQKSDADYIEVIAKLKKQLLEIQEDFNVSKEKNEEQAKEVIRSQKQAASEFEKEKALMNQKIEYLEKSLKDKTDKEKEYAQDWRTQKSGLSQEIKVLSQKHELEMKTLMQSLEEERDKLSDLESKLAEKCQKNEQIEEKSKQIEFSLKSQIKDAQILIKELQESKNQIKQQTMTQFTTKQQQAQQEFLQQKQLIDEMERKLKESIEQQLLTSHDSKKQVAMRDQKIEFLEMQLKDLKEQLEESQRQHAQMVKALNQRNQNSDDESESTQNKIELLQKEFSQTNEQQIQQIKEIQSELTQVRQELDLSESQARKYQNESERQISDIKQLLEESEQQKISLIEKIKTLETLRLKASDDQKTQEQQSKLKFEKELLEREEHFKMEIKDQQQRNDEQITQLKSFYDLEKEKVELRITEEKERSQRRLATYQEEQEARFREEFRDKDSEIECLQQQLLELEQHQQNYSTQAEHEISLKQLQLEGLERQNNDLKDRINKLEMNRNNSFDKQLEHFDQQRQELNGRIDKLMQENLQKDKLMAQLTHKLERTQDQLDHRNAEFDQVQELIDKDKQILLEKCEQTKIALSEVQDEAMQNKLESGREIALLNQQVEFLNRKIDDLQRSNEDGQSMFDDKLKVIRQEIYEDAQAQVDRITSEKELWESKYEQKRKALKDLETSLGKKISDLEKQSSLQQSTIQKLEVERQNKEHTFNDEISRLQSQLMNNDILQNQNQMFGSVPAEEMLRMKTSLQDTERELQDLQSNYDRDKALWEGKVNFLETQKDNYKKDLIESQRKFELTLEQLQKRGSQNKERQETSQQAILKVLESKYKAQIKEMIESQQSQSQDQKEKTKKLEVELAQANEKLNLYSKNRYDEVNLLEKKLIESKQNEQRLQNDFNDLQIDTNRKFEELIQQMQREKESLKQKVFEAEKRAKEAEQKRTQLLFSIEKERANWQLEEDHLRRKQCELEEFIQNLERSKENLKKENSKLRNDARGHTPVGGAQKKSFIFAKGVQQLLNSTAQQMSNPAQQVQTGTIKSNLILRTGSFNQTDKSASQAFSGTTQGSSNEISSNCIVNAAMSRLKENQAQTFQELKQSTSQSDLKLRHLASPDVSRQHKSPLLVNRAGQNNFKPLIPPRQPLMTGSISSYNMLTPSAQNDTLSNNGSTNGISQGFKLNLQNRYNSQGNSATPDENQ